MAKFKHENKMLAASAAVLVGNMVKVVLDLLEYNQSKHETEPWVCRNPSHIFTSILDPITAVLMAWCLYDLLPRTPADKLQAAAETATGDIESVPASSGTLDPWPKTWEEKRTNIYDNLRQGYCTYPLMLLLLCATSYSAVKSWLNWAAGMHCDPLIEVSSDLGKNLFIPLAFVEAMRLLGVVGTFIAQRRGVAASTIPRYAADSDEETGEHDGQRTNLLASCEQASKHRGTDPPIFAREPTKVDPGRVVKITKLTREAYAATQVTLPY
tara:strand:- start:3159 stop:3965 length:807 start_codon:yes stop_codon:yes gene_type:complete